MNEEDLKKTRGVLRSRQKQLEHTMYQMQNPGFKDKHILLLGCIFKILSILFYFFKRQVKQGFL